MNRLLDTGLVVLAGGMAMLMMSPAAEARPLTVTCASSTPFPGNATLCSTFAPLSFRSDGADVPFYVHVVAPRSHCSDVTYMIFRDGGTDSLGFSRRLRPGEADNIEIGGGFARGTNRIQVAAIGHVGGCNAGAILSWGVDASVAPVP